MLEGQESPRNVTGATKKGFVGLSEQELVDCSAHNNGCDGGSFVLDDIMRLGGIEAERDYSYIARRSDCKLTKSKVVISDFGGLILPFADEPALKKVVAKFGPFATAMASAEQLQSYSDGVLVDKSCYEDALNHGVLIVGYGTDSKLGDFWIVKNSWSNKWGDKGYFRTRRGVNVCGIATVPTVPKF